MNFSTVSEKQSRSESLTPGDRFTAVMSGDSGMRSLFLRNFTVSLDALSLKTTDIFSEKYDSEKASDSIAAFQKITGQDAVVGCIHSPAFIVEQFGGGMKYPEHGIPTVTKAPISSPDSLENLCTVPKGKALDAIESYRLTRKKLPDIAVVANITGPLTKASVMMGMEQLSFAILSDKDYVRDVIDIGTEFTYSALESMYRDNSVDSTFIASASDNNDLFGDDALSEFTFPYLKDAVSKVHKIGSTVTFHPHGDYTEKDLIEKSIKTGIDCFQFAENNDPVKIHDSIGKKCIIMGGTDIVPVLYSGTEQEIRDSVGYFMKIFSDSRYIFSCSCSLQTGTPLDNICALSEEFHSICSGETD